MRFLTLFTILLATAASVAPAQQAVPTPPPQTGTQTYPDLPVGIKNGVGGLIGQTLYAGLGTAGQKFYALDLSKTERAWVEVAPFPDAPRDQAAYAVMGEKLYVFGGSGKSSPEATTAVFNQVHVYDPAVNAWTLLPTRAPREIAGGAAVVQGDRIILFGGVNRNIFDGYFRDIAAAGTDKARSDAIARAYFTQRAQDYFFGQDMESYAPAKNVWQSLGTVPFGGRAGAAFVYAGPTLTVVGGEIKPGLRSPATYRASWQGDALRWQNLGDLPAPATSAVQDGVAGPFAGVSGGAVLVAGGANFPGSNAKYAAGTLYAHEGLPKTWYSDVYALRGNRWSIVGQLPQPQGYGVSIQHGNEIIMVGGEVQGGAASPKVVSVELKDGKLLLRD